MCLHALVPRLLLIWCIRDEHRRFLSCGEKYVSENCHRLTRSNVAFFNGALQHRADTSQSINGFKFSPSSPAQDGRPVDQEDLLNLGRQRCVKKANPCRN